MRTAIIITLGVTIQKEYIYLYMIFCVQIKDCAEVATARKMEAMMEDKEFQQKYGACFTNQCYSEKEMGAMTEMMEMMAGMQCWDKAFTKACTSHIKENLMSMASNMLAGR